MGSISDDLLELAKNKKLCSQFQKEWVQKDIHELVEFFKKHPDWCLERQYPSLLYLKKHFDSEEVRCQGVYVDRKVNETLSDQVYIFINCTGYCKVKFDPEKAIFPMIYVSLDSNMHFEIDGSSTPIQIYDNSTVTASAINGGSFKLYYESNTAD